MIAGRALFGSANCANCHGGPQWTRSRINFTPPPAAAAIVRAQLIDQLRPVGTFDPAAFNEVRQEVRQNVVAGSFSPLGADGFSPAPLLSLFAFPQTFFHNGAANSLSAVLDNVTHRSAGTGGVDTLANPADRQKLVQFLSSIDSGTVPFP